MGCAVVVVVVLLLTVANVGGNCGIECGWSCVDLHGGLGDDLRERLRVDRRKAERVEANVTRERTIAARRVR